ncbi:MAG: hypothetical protein E7635_07535 [Ruminococcaceae bacterium]|nr:hypothetical protein [Oscillospiraceae bacterium]
MKNKNKFLSFGAFVIYFLIIFAIATVILMSALSSYLEEYEKYQPSTIANEVKDYFSAKNSAQLSLIPAEGETVLAPVFPQYIKRIVNEENLFCYKSSSSDQTLIYDYISNNKKIASLLLSKTNEKSKRGFDIYEIDHIKWYPVFKYTITAPDDCKIFINDIEINADNATIEVISKNDVYEDFDGYVTSLVRYNIDNLNYITNVRAEFDSKTVFEIVNDGDDLDFEVNYTVNKIMPEEMKAEIEARTHKAVEAYVYYTTLHSIPVSTVLPYIHPKAALYKNVQRFDNTWSNSKTSDEFLKFEISDFKYYTDTKASCRADVIYQIIKYYNTKREFDFNFDIYLAKENGQWYVTSMERVHSDK